MGDYYDVDISQDASDTPGITGTPVTGIEGPPSILSPEVYQDPIMDMAAEQAAAEAAAAQAAAAASAAAAQRAVDRNRGDGDNRSSPNEAAGRAAENAQRAAIQDAARAGMTVNQAKASVGMPANLGDIGGGGGGGGGGKLKVSPVIITSGSSTSGTGPGGL